MDIDSIIDSIHKIPKKSKESLKENVKEVNLPKGHLLISANKIANTLYFIKKGIVRAYSDTENNQVTFWFGKEGDTVISMRSYVSNEKGYENIELLEDCDLYQLNAENIKKLYNEDVHIANWGRKFAEQELLKIEERLISGQYKTASERYSELIASAPHLIHRVQLGHIASYLGITQVSLSRIRSDIK